MPRAVPRTPSGSPSSDLSLRGPRTPTPPRAGDPPPLLDDLARAAAGDGPAADRVLRALYVRVRTRVRRRLARYPAHVVADAVQEAMARVIAYLPRCRAASDRQLVRWALLVGWHAALRYVRSPAAGMAIGWDGVPIDTLLPAGDEAWTGVDGPAWDDFGRHQANGAEPGAAEADRGAADRGPVVGIWMPMVCPDPNAGPVGPGRPEGGAERASGAAGGDEATWTGEIPAPAELLWALLAGAVADENREHLVLVWERAALGRSYQEVADARGITPGAAKQRYQRTVARLRRAVAARAARLPAPLRAVALRYAALPREPAASAAHRTAA